MKEYISKEYINNLLEHLKDIWHGPDHYTCSVIQDKINEAPDAAIIRMYECSHCGLLTSEEYRHCPYCGELMEAEYDGN